MTSELTQAKRAVAFGARRTGDSNLLRNLAAFGVVLGHVSTSAIYNNPDPDLLQWRFAVYCGLFCVWTVPCFIMLSGDMYAARGEERFEFSRWIRRLRKIFLITAAAAACFDLMWLVIGRFGDLGLVGASLGGNPYFHLWYLYFAVGLIAISPLLTALKARLPRWLLWAGIIAVFIASGIGSLPGTGLLAKIPVGLGFLAYFLIGADLRNWPAVTKGEAWFWGIAFVATWLVSGTAFILFEKQYGIVDTFAFAASLSGPIAAVMAIAVFRLVRLIPLPRWNNTIAPATLLIYVIHPVWVLIFEYFGLDITWHGFLIGIPVVFACVLAAAIISALALRKIKQKGLALIPQLR